MGAGSRWTRWACGHPEEVLLHLLPALYAARNSPAHLVGVVLATSLACIPFGSAKPRGLRAAASGPAAGALLPLALIPAAPGLTAVLVGASAASLALGVERRLVAVAGAMLATGAAAFSGAGSAVAGMTAAAVPVLAAACVELFPGAFSAPEAALTALGAVAGLQAACTASPPAPAAAAGVACSLAGLAALVSSRFRGRLGALPLAVAVAAGYMSACALLGAEPVSWTAFHILTSRERSLLTLGWALGLALCVRLPSRLAPRVGRVAARKLFHVLAAAVFLPGLEFDPSFLAFASSGALAGLLVLEAARAAALPGADALDGVAGPLLDARDGAGVRVTHLYLLAGCAAPVWMRRSLDVQAAGGLVTLGVLDAVAAAAGKRFGKTKWPRGAGRTVEGSVAGIAAGVLFCAPLVWVEGSLWAGLGTAAFATVMAGLLEAHSTQIDNLVLPLYFYGVMDMMRR